MAPATHLPTTYSLIDFVNFKAINLLFKITTSRSARASISVTEQKIDGVRKIIEDDPHSTYQQIETLLGISSMAINSIIHDYLNLRKVCA